MHSNLFLIPTSLKSYTQVNNFSQDAQKNLFSGNQEALEPLKDFY